MTQAGEAEVAAAAPGRFRHLSAAGAWDLVLELGGQPESLLILDLRDETSFRRSHLDGAEHFDQRRVPALLRDTPKTASVIVYCYHGHASQLVAALFGSSGFENAFSVDGGFEALAHEHERRRSEDAEQDASSPTLPLRRYVAGDCVYARDAIRNDGGVPDLENDALLAAAGARGMVVQVGHAEANPRQTLYAVRFEDAQGNLGPLVGCLPEELTPATERETDG